MKFLPDAISVVMNLRSLGAAVALLRSNGQRIGRQVRRMKSSGLFVAAAENIRNRQTNPRLLLSQLN